MICSRVLLTKLNAIAVDTQMGSQLMNECWPNCWPLTRRTANISIRRQTRTTVHCTWPVASGQWPVASGPPSCNEKKKKEAEQEKWNKEKLEQLLSLSGGKQAEGFETSN